MEASAWWQYLVHQIGSASWPTGLLAVLVSCIGGALICGWLRTRGAAGRQGKLPLPPGSMGWPLLGETLQFALFSTAAIGTPLPFFASRVQRYGPIFKTHLVGRPAVVSTDPDLTKLLLANDEKLTQRYLPDCFLRFLGPAIYLRGASHRAFRELASLSVGSNTVQKLHMDIFQDHILACLRSWQDSSSNSSTHIVNAQTQCKEWALTYSVKYFLGLEADDPITQALLRDFFYLPTSFFFIPINLPGTTFNKAVKARERINSTLVKLVRSRILEARKEAKDFLDILLKQTNDNSEYYAGVHAADWISSFIFGAFENTAALFANILKFLSENKHVVDELQKENFGIRKAKAHEEKLTWDDYQNMHFTQNVVKEALRMGSVVHTLFLETLEDISFKGMAIPKGWIVVVNFSTVHLNENYFPNPLQFDPWRWEDSSRANPNFLVAFGGGPRRCPGATLAIFEVSIFIHYFVTLYKWKRIHQQGGDKHGDLMDCLSLPFMRNGLFLKLEALDLDAHEK